MCSLLAITGFATSCDLVYLKMNAKNNKHPRGSCVNIMRVQSMQASADCSESFFYLLFCATNENDSSISLFLSRWTEA